MKVNRPRGTRDFSPGEMHKRIYVKKQMEKVFRSFNYRETAFPAIEHAQLFEVKSGEEIQEHMYVFEDKGGRKICLRPEATASVCRMFNESLRDSKKPLKLYYYCPMYRYERPQKGRYREFWHMGVELIGAESRESDAEVISVVLLEPLAQLAPCRHICLLEPLLHLGDDLVLGLEIMLDIHAHSSLGEIPDMAQRCLLRNPDRGND